MANKQSFTPEEWTKILESTMLAGMAVSAADPSGVWGLVKGRLCEQLGTCRGEVRCRFQRTLEGNHRRLRNVGRDDPPFRRRCARGSPGPSRPTPFSAPLPIFARSRPF